MKKLTLSLMLLCCITMVAQKYEFQAYQCSFNWSNNWLHSKSRVIIDFDSLRINITSKKPQELKILKTYILESFITHSTFRYYAIDKEKKHCYLNLHFYMDNHMVLEVIYQNFTYRYRMRRPSKLKITLNNNNYDEQQF